MGLGGLGMWEMLLIFLVVLLLFGAKRLPEIGSSLGKGIREFKGSIREIEREVQAVDEPKRDAVPPPSDSADGPDEAGPRRLRTTPPPGQAVNQPGGVPTREEPTQDAPEVEASEEGSEEASEEEEAPRE